MTDDLPPLPEARWQWATGGRPYCDSYSAEQMRTYASMAAKRALDAREFIHAESSRIYARLAAAVRGGADDATLAAMLRAEVAERRAKDNA